MVSHASRTSHASHASHASHVFRSEYADVAPVELPIHEAVLGRVAEYGDRPALVDGLDGTTLGYDRLDHFTRRLAAALAAAGVRKGEVLALHSPNSVLFPVVFYAASRCGAAVTTVHPLATEGEFATQLADSGARWIVTVSALLDTARGAAQQSGGIAEILVCDRAEGHRSVQDLVACTDPEPSVPLDPADDLAVLPYSSGTTGTPKGVMLTHRSIATNLAQLTPLVSSEPDDRVLAVLPFFHIYGLTALMNAPCATAPPSWCCPASTCGSSSTRSRSTASPPSTSRPRSSSPSPNTRWSPTTTSPPSATSSPPRRPWTPSWRRPAPGGSACRRSCRRTA